MKPLQLRVSAVASATVCVFLLGYFCAFAQDTKTQSKGWVDVDHLTEVERLKDRPGNFQVLAALGNFFDGIYQIRPDYSQCAFPLQLDSKTIDTLESLEISLDEEAKDGKKPKNKLRQFILNVKALSIYDAEVVANSAEEQKKLGIRLKRFMEVRKRHPGKAVMVFADAELLSLQSSKVEGRGDPLLLYLVQDKGTWKVAWFDK